MTLARVVHRIATDHVFAKRLLQEPQATLAAADFVLDDESITALLAVLGDGVHSRDLCSPTMDPLDPYPWYIE